jgi:hypothetical protein
MTTNAVTLESKAVQEMVDVTKQNASGIKNDRGVRTEAMAQGCR